MVGSSGFGVFCVVVCEMFAAWAEAIVVEAVGIVFVEIAMALGIAINGLVDVSIDAVAYSRCLIVASWLGDVSVVVSVVIEFFVGCR